MLRTIKNYDEFKQYLRDRDIDTSSDIVNTCNAIIENVRKNGDAALKEYSEKFDKVKVDTFKIDEEEIEKAYAQMEPAFIEAMEGAKKNIEFFHKAQLREGYELQKEDGVYLGQRILPIERVGLYVPGGTAAYPSSVLMNVIPAKIAGVQEVILCTPPNTNPSILAAAKIAGVDAIYTVGGAQAIAAMAYGTESIPRVDKIAGPGNAFVATAKKLVYGKVDIDMIAGPSEILVIADVTANPKFVVADLISQSEHDPMASSILLTTSSDLVEKVKKELRTQVDALPRKEIIEKAFSAYGVSMVLDSIEECVRISNEIAPEHLEIMCEEPKKYLDKIKNAGSVFLGYYSCESIGDYYGGTNHVLPTNGTARFYSALNVDNFMKKSSYLFYSEAALKKDGDKIVTIAEKEGLEGHANAVKVRM